MVQSQSKFKNTYSISYRNHVNQVCYSDVRAYTEKQALFLFYKFHTDCVELLQVNKY